MNPFAQSRALAAATSSAAQHNAASYDIIFFPNNTKSNRPFFFPLTRHRILPPTSQITMAAASTGLLFGTKSWMDQQNNNNNSSSLPSFCYSFVSGAVVGAFQAGVSAFTKPKSTTTTTATSLQHQNSIITKHAIAATCYFGTYDLIMGILSTSEDSQHHKLVEVSSSSSSSLMSSSSSTTSTSTLSILTAGALAGCVHSTILGPISTITAATAINTTTMVRWMLTSLRAAPAHALIFYGYESLKRNFKPIVPPRSLYKKKKNIDDDDKYDNYYTSQME